jgi:hypothetical protein
MANNTYEEVLHEAQALSPEERAQLRQELTQVDAGIDEGDGALIVEHLRAHPFDPEMVDEMERAIIEGCERIE